MKVCYSKLTLRKKCYSTVFKKVKSYALKGLGAIFAKFTTCDSSENWASWVKKILYNTDTEKSNLSLSFRRKHN